MDVKTLEAASNLHRDILRAEENIRESERALGCVERCSCTISIGTWTQLTVSHEAAKRVLEESIAARKAELSRLKAEFEAL